MTPTIYYRGEGSENILNQEEADFLKEQGLTVTEVKPYLVNGKEEYYADDEATVLKDNGYDLTLKIQPQETPKEVVQKKADYAKAEYWNKNRQMSNVEVDTEFSERYIGDDAFEGLKKQYQKAREKDPRNGLTQVRFGSADAERTFIATQIDPVYKEYQKQLVLKNGVVPVPDTETDTALRNRHYAAKIAKEAQREADPKQIDDLDRTIKGYQMRMAAAQRRGDNDLVDALAIDMEKAMVRRKRIASQGVLSNESWENQVEKIEKRTGANFLTGDEYGLSDDIRKLDNLQEVYLELSNRGVGKNTLSKHKEYITAQEEKVSKGWEKLNSDADKEVERLQKLKESLESDKETLTDQLRGYEEAGATGAIEKTQQRIDALNNEIADIDNKANQTANRKELFFTMKSNPEQAAQDALNVYGGEDIPGGNAQEKIRNLYAILASQYTDWGAALTKKMAEAGQFDAVNLSPTGMLGEGMFSKWGSFLSRVSNVDMSGFEMEEIKKLAALEDQLKAIAPLAMLNRAPIINNEEGAADVFLSTYLNSQNPLTDRTTNQDIATNVVNSVRMVATSEDEYNTGVFDNYEELSSPYKHFSSKDFAMMLGQTADIMTDMIATELLTAGLPGTFVKGLGEAMAVKKALDGASRISVIANKVGRGVSKAMWTGLEEGAKFETAGLVSGSEDELNFINGFFGGGIAKVAGTPFASESVKKFAYQKLVGLYGTKTPQALARIKNFGVNSKIAIEQLGRGPAEAIQEFGEEMGSIYQESESWDQVKEKFQERFGNMSDVMHFAVMSAVMGYGMGVGNVVGDYWTARNKGYYSKLTDDEKKQFSTFLQEIAGEWEVNLDEYEQAISGEGDAVGTDAQGADKTGDTANTEVQPDTSGDGKTQEVLTETVKKMGATEELGLVEGAAVGTIGNTEVVLIDNGDSVTIDSIYTPEESRGQGGARAAMEQIVRVADEEGKELNLQVVPQEDSGTDRQRLEDFYKDYGFELQEDGLTMIRPVGGVNTNNNGTELQAEPTEVSGDTETEGGISEREAAIAEEEAALAEAERQVTGEGGVETGTLPVSSIAVRPDVFQFKAIENEGGTNNAEKIKSKKWNPNLAGTVSVWVDSKGEIGKPGQVYVVDGHHRMQFAKEQGVENVNVYYMKADTAAEARKEAALANIIMNRGTAIDAAKLFREMDAKEIDDSIVNSKNGRDGQALAKLSDSLFKMVVDGKLSVDRGVILSGAKDHTRQEAVYQETLGKGAIGKNIKNSTLKEYVDAANATESETVTQVDLFGETQAEKVDVKASMDFRADVRQKFLSDKTIFGAAARNADVLNEAGNRIDAEMSEGRSREAAENIALFDAFKNNVLKAVLDEGAKRYADTKSRSEKAKILEETYNNVVERAKQELSGGVVKTGVKAKNLKQLYDINRKLFGLNRVQSLSNAIVMDRMIGQMAKRANVSKDEIYKRLEFQKSIESDVSKGILLQVDAWHGSPYLFDKFTTNSIGTGEGAQAFGWGLYFTTIQDIAKSYAEKLSRRDIKRMYENDEDMPSKAYDALEAVGFLGYEEEWAAASAFYEESKQATMSNYDLTEEEYDNINNGFLENKRNLYKVAIHKGRKSDQYTWMEWKSPLTQKQVKDIKQQALKEGVDVSGVDFSGDGANVYMQLGQHWYFKGIKKHPKETSLFLLRAGIDGIKYPAESISKGATNDNARGFNYVVFDENAISIEEVIKYQKSVNSASGAAMVALDGQAVIYALTDPNVSTPLHELAHVYEHYLTTEERNDILKWAGHKEWSIDTSEKFARGFERYLADGVAPTAVLQKIFDRFKEWLTDIYNGIKGSDIDIELNDDMKRIYSQMLGVDTKNGIDKAVDFLDGMLTDLDNFGKENLSMGLPIVVLKGALEVAKQVLKTTGDINKAIERAVANVKASEWYKNLKNQEEKSMYESVVTRIVTDSSLSVDETVLTDGPEVWEASRIVKEAKANNTYMKAPNGKPTNLTEDQWVYVRTQAFKAWFGEWIQSPEKASKVVDENGEPRVVYHGTMNVFQEFNASMLKGITKEGVYFASNRNVAETYGGNVIESFLNIKTPASPGNNTSWDSVQENLVEWFDSVVEMIQGGRINYDKIRSVNAPYETNNDSSYWESIDSNKYTLTDRDGVIAVEYFDMQSDSINEASDIYIVLDNYQIRPAKVRFEGLDNKSMIDRIDGLINKLDVFGKESLSMGLPIVVAKKILQAAKAALIATNNIQEALKAALEYMRDTDWYKSLTDKEKKDAETGLEDLIVNNKSDNVFAEALSSPDNPARDMASSFVASATANKDGSYSGTKNSVRFTLSQDKGGGVRIESLATAKNQTGKGKEVRVLKELIKLAEQMNIPLVYRASVMNGLSSLENRALFLEAGFVPSTKNTDEVMFAPLPSKSDARKALMKQFDEQIKSGATLDDMLAQVDAQDYGSVVGVSNFALKNALRNMYERYTKQGLNTDTKAKRKKRGLYERLYELVYTDEDIQMDKEMGIDPTYEILNNEKFDVAMRELFDSIMEESDGDVGLAANAIRHLIAEAMKDAILSKDYTTVPAMHVNLLHKLIHAARKEGDNQLALLLADELAKLGTGVGRASNQFSEDSSPQAFVNRAAANYLALKNEKTEADKALLEEMAKEMRKSIRELFDKDIDIERLLEEIAGKDEEIAKLLKDLADAEAQINSQVSSANNKNQQTAANARVKPNRTADKARSLADKMRQLAAGMKSSGGGAGSGILSIMTPNMLAKALEAFASALEKTANTLDAFDAAFQSMRGDKDYTSASKDDQVQMGKDLNSFLMDNVDGLQDDINNVAKEYVKPKIFTKSASGKKVAVTAQKVSLKELIANHLSGNLDKNRSLAETIARRTGIQDDAALKSLEDAIYQGIKDRVQAALAKQLENYFEKQKAISQDQKKIVLETMAKQVMMGALSNEAVVDAFAEYYGFKALTPEIIRKLEAFVEILEQLKASKDAAGAMRVAEEFSEYLRNNTDIKLDLAQLAIDYVNMGVLSGAKTQTNALWGAITEIIPQLIAKLSVDFVRNPAAVVSAMVNALSDGSITKALKASYAAGARGENVLEAKGYLNEGSAPSATPEYKYFEKLIKDGYKKGNPIIKRVLSVAMQPVRLIFWLGAQDAFINGTVSNYLEYVDQYHQATGNKSWVARLNPAAIAKIHSSVRATLNPQKNDTAFQSQVEQAYRDGLEKFKTLGIKPPLFYRSVLEKTMIDNYREAMGVQMHQETVKDWMLMANPTGVYARALVRIRKAWRYSPDASVVEKVARVTLAVILMLPRITLASMQKAERGTPGIGIFSALLQAQRGKITVIKNGKTEEIPIQNKAMHIYKAFIFNAMMTSMITAIGMNMFLEDEEEDDDDKYARDPQAPNFFGRRLKLNPDRVFDISSGIGEYNVLQDTKDAPYEMRVKINGEWKTITKLNYLPSMQVGLNLLGMWRDELKYTAKEKRRNIGASDIVASYFDILGEATYSQLSRDVKSVGRADKFDKLSKVGEAFSRIPYQFIPSAYRDMIYTALSTQEIERIKGRNAMMTLAQIADIVDDDGVPFIDNYGYSLPYPNQIYELPIINMFSKPQRYLHAEGKVQYELFDSREGILDKKIGRSNFSNLAKYENKGGGKYDRGEAIIFGDYTTEEKDALTVAARTMYGKALERNAEVLSTTSDSNFIQFTNQLRSASVEKAQVQYFYLFAKNGNDIEKNTQELINMNRDEK